MVSLCKPAAFNAAAFLRKMLPLVVKVRSNGLFSGVRTCASISINTSKFLRSNGSPPVRRIFSTPKLAKIEVRRVISSKLVILAGKDKGNLG